MDGAVDVESGLAFLEADLPADAAGLRLGESVAAEIAIGERAKGLIVPLAALVGGGDEEGVFAVGDDQVAHLHPVKVLARDGSRAAVSGEGLSDGVRVVVDGNYGLPDGAKVREESPK